MGKSKEYIAKEMEVIEDLQRIKNTLLPMLKDEFRAFLFNNYNFDICKDSAGKIYKDLDLPVKIYKKTVKNATIITQRRDRKNKYSSSRVF